MNLRNCHEEPVRADVLLAEAHPQYSRAALARLFEMDMVRRGDKILKPGDKIQPGISFEADISPLEKPADDIDLPILYEDDDVIVINKPTGVISHARGRYWDEPSVASFVRAKVSDMSGERAGIVHRLDRATSGVMICAKNANALSMLQRQFSQRKVKKSYYAVVSGIPEPTEAIIDIPLGRNPKDPKTFQPDPHGKSALTHYIVAETNGEYSLLHLTPQTGRTHQLRVHLAHIKHPILGDTVYAGAQADRLYLHAYSLEITLPNRQRTTLKSELPLQFRQKVN